jgi:hypothetical protein
MRSIGEWNDVVFSQPSGKMPQPPLPQPPPHQAFTDDEKRLLDEQNQAAIFTYIHDRNLWRGKESISGAGSDSDQTAALVSGLPTLLETYGIRSITDIPCGDFAWMKKALPENCRYVGGDIVTQLVLRNQATHANPHVQFEGVDITLDPLPPADLLLCRDCLVHLSFRHALAAVGNMLASDFTFLLLTTFPGRDCNEDIPTGLWRPLNLEKAPFNFPPPISLLSEECSEGDGAYGDKSLGLWRAGEVRASLQLHPATGLVSV